MRPPRYRFPDQVRTITRSMAARMVHDGAVATTPEELDAWVASAPDTRAALRRGGYGAAFTAHDLFPLFQVFVAEAEGSRGSAGSPQGSSQKRWLVALLVLLVVVLLVAVVAYTRR
ncbi:MAG: hypothetical protein JO040_01015 [Gemmatimonadetes bacterium]|nr:hypothetical protein [Gemmatimonadota bacterium]